MIAIVVWQMNYRSITELCLRNEIGSRISRRIGLQNGKDLAK